MPSCASFGLATEDGGRSSTVEPRIVVPVVAGSNPVGHPSDQIPVIPAPVQELTHERSPRRVKIFQPLTTGWKCSPQSDNSD